VPLGRSAILFAPLTAAASAPSGAVLAATKIQVPGVRSVWFRARGWCGC
jgi:hypothetical protein